MDSSSSLVSWSIAMENISLQCEGCSYLLDSVNEAYFHEDLYGHTVEPILNLSCTLCHEHCRSKTEKDSHTKFTGHNKFTNRTSPNPNSNSDETGVEEEMIGSVEAKLIPELEALGLSTATSKKALRYSGSESIKGAVNWIMQNADYVDIDKMPLISSCTNYELLGPSLVEMEIDPQELREEEDKRAEIEKLKEMIRKGDALFEATMEEINERNRLSTFCKAEKDEEPEWREVHQKLQADDVEVERKLGLPADVTSVSNPAALVVKEKKPFVQPTTASKEKAMRDILVSLKQNHLSLEQNHKDEDAEVKSAEVKSAFETLSAYVVNVANNPDVEKFRTIRFSNKRFHDKLGSFKEGIDFLELCGFLKATNENVLFLPRDKVDDVVLNSAMAVLNSALTNCFFGLLNK